MLEALDPAVIMDLLEIFQLYTPPALAYVPPEDKDSSAGVLVGGDPRDTRKSDRKWSDPAKNMCVLKPAATVDTQSFILPGNL